MRKNKMSSQLAALVLAAGYSSRMSALKSLYPIDGELMIERIIRILNEGGIGKIHVVLGHGNELLKRLLCRGSEYKGVTIVQNPDYSNGMFSSVLAGVKSLPPDAAGFLLLPVDYPFVMPETISEIIKLFDESGADIISPAYAGKKGHPPAVRNTVFEDIINDSEKKGLDRILQHPGFSTALIDTDDEGILTDIDDDESYLRLLKKSGIVEPAYPLPGRCEQIYKELSVDESIIRHMNKVKETALDIAEKLNSSGLRLNPGLLAAAAKLHDICKTDPDHAAAAGSYLNRMGYPELALIVSKHMNIDFSGEIDEAAVLYLADKMTEGEVLSDLNVRLHAKLEEFKGNAEAEFNITERFDKAFLIGNLIDEIIKKAEADTGRFEASDI